MRISSTNRSVQYGLQKKRRWNSAWFAQCRCLGNIVWLPIEHINLLPPSVVCLLLWVGDDRCKKFTSTLPESCINSCSCYENMLKGWTIALLSATPSLSPSLCSALVNKSTISPHKHFCLWLCYFYVCSWFSCVGRFQFSFHNCYHNYVAYVYVYCTVLSVTHERLQRSLGWVIDHPLT